LKFHRIKYLNDYRKGFLNFGKMMFKILLKRVDIPLQNYWMCMTCICFHNLCIIHENNFDMKWAKEIKHIM
jgi:hypothetical protein